MVRKLGLENVPHKLRAMLPEMDFTNEGHRDRYPHIQFESANTRQSIKHRSMHADHVV